MAARKLDHTSTDALVLNGRACVLLGEWQSGVDCAEEALNQGPRTTLVLFNAACVYAGAALHLQSEAQRGGSYEYSQARRFQAEAVKLLGEALAQEKEEKGESAAKKLWQAVLTEKVLQGLTRSLEMQELARSYGTSR
jgi:hypothetical protein